MRRVDHRFYQSLLTQLLFSSSLIRYRPKRTRRHFKCWRVALPSIHEYIHQSLMTNTVISRWNGTGRQFDAINATEIHQLPQLADSHHISVVGAYGHVGTNASSRSKLCHQSPRTLRHVDACRHHIHQFLLHTYVRLIPLQKPPIVPTADWSSEIAISHAGIVSMPQEELDWRLYRLSLDDLGLSRSVYIAPHERFNLYLIF